jgi:hypothetical protein
MQTSARPGTDTGYAYAVEDQPPVNWVVGRISEGGSYDAISRKIKFGPYFDLTPRTLSYEVTPPSTETSGATFNGVTSADGFNLPIQGNSTILPPPLHPADLSPADQRISIGETTVYATAWRNGRPWNAGPNPIPLDYVTRAGLLWKMGEAYRFDPAVLRPPLWWVSAAARTTSGVRPSSSGSGLSIARRILPRAFIPNQPFTLRIIVEPAAEVTVYALEERCPEGLAMINPSDNGQVDESNGIIRWGPYFDHSTRELTCQLFPLSTRVAGASFTGAASFDGATELIQGAQTLLVGAELNLTRGGAPESLRLSLGGVDGLRYQVEASSDLRRWQPLTALTNLTGEIILQPEFHSSPYYFYRTRVEP